MPDYSIDAAIKFVAETFAQELQKLRDRRTDRNYQPDALILRVEVGEKGGMSIEHAHGYGNNVRAADLGTLLDEIYRRAGFDDREAGKLQAMGDRLLALPGATDA